MVQKGEKLHYIIENLQLCVVHDADEMSYWPSERAKLKDALHSLEVTV